MNIFVRVIRKAVRGVGWDMIHYAPWQNLWTFAGIDRIFDVGANRGQSYDSFRWSGFQGPICSFEPNPEMFKILQSRKGYDWQRLPLALSSKSGNAKFHLTESDNSNSLQTPLTGLRVTDEITVAAVRLDEFWQQQGFQSQRAFLKIDTEGHDMEVVKGASGVLDRIQLIMVETGPIQRYQDEPTMSAMFTFMEELGFCVCRVEKNSYSEAAGMDTAMDVVFARRELVHKAQR